MIVYCSSESDKLKPYISNFEKASTGATVKDTVIAAIAYANVLYGKRFGTTAKN